MFGEIYLPIGESLVRFDPFLSMCESMDKGPQHE